MSFKLFIYYCALCGGWAAFVAWACVQGFGFGPDGPHRPASDEAGTALIACLLGLLVAAAVGTIDALLNTRGAQRIGRVLLCLMVGAMGGLTGGFLGEWLYQQAGVPRTFGWMLVGVAIGASVGVFDLLQALATPNTLRGALKKVRNGILGGLLGGCVGGLLFDLVLRSTASLPRSSLATGLAILGVCIGLLIGLAQVILKEAWLRVESGFRAGRELMLSKEETTIGRAEACDVGLFGDKAVERLHARILLRDNRYLLADANSPGGTYLNDRRVTEPSPLRSGDAIRVGGCVLRFGERQKRK
jgi:hypothetical protein